MLEKHSFSRILALMAAFTLIAAACGDDDSESSDETTMTAAPDGDGDDDAGGIANATYEEITDIASVRAHGQYRILTPEAYRDELDAMGDAAFAMLHPMVGGIPPALAWRHLELFERAVLTR